MQQSIDILQNGDGINQHNILQNGDGKHTCNKA